MPISTFSVLLSLETSDEKNVDRDFFTRTEEFLMSILVIFFNFEAPKMNKIAITNLEIKIFVGFKF